MEEDAPKLLNHLHWVGHDSFRLDQPIVIYLDPWRLPPDSPTADLILISHEHNDHCSPEDVALVRGQDTVVITNPSAAPNIELPIRIMRAGDSTEVEGVKVEALPAYNLDKPFHPKQAGHLGFVLTVNGERLYFAGDTDVIPEMGGLEIDVALMPVSGTYVMTAEEAAHALEGIQTRVAIPMHYGAGVVGTVEDAARFKELSPVPVRILSTGG